MRYHAISCMAWIYNKSTDSNRLTIEKVQIVFVTIRSDDHDCAIILFVERLGQSQRATEVRVVAPCRLQFLKQDPTAYRSVSLELVNIHESRGEI